MENIKRINLLSDAELTDLYVRPEFNNIEQELYFTLTQQEQTILNHYKDINTRVYFILQLGYFKAKQQFFKFNFTEVNDDVNFILKTHFAGAKLTLLGYLSRDYIKKQKQDILALFNYHDWSAEYESQVEEQLCELLRYYPKSHNALRQLLNYFDNQQIVIPTYRKLQDIFTAAFRLEEERLSQYILSIPEPQQKQLAELIENDDGLSQLNIVRADQKDFQFTAVRAEVEKAQGIADLYVFAKSFIPTLKLAKNAVHYYADMVDQYTVSRLRKLSKTQQWLHVICFVYHRYQQIMDNLITSFMYHAKAILDAGNTYAAMAQMEYNSHMAVDFPKLAQFLNWFPNRDKELSYSALNQEAYKILPEEQFLALSKFLAGNKFDKEAARWEFYAKSSRMFSLYLRPILMAVPFEFYKENSKIMELIDLLKTHYMSGKNPAMFKLADDLGLTIPKHMTQYLKSKSTNEGIDPYLFEFYVYKKMHHQIDRGKLFCNDSMSYSDIDFELVEDALVDKVEEIAAKFGYPKIPIYCDKRLDDALELLDNTWDITTENISLGRNKGFNIKENKDGKQEWGLLYDSSEKLNDAFFRKLPKVEIADMLMFVGERVDLWEGFEHMKDRYLKRKAPIPLAMNACLLAEAFGLSTEKMAEMSDLNVNLLKATREDFIRVDTLCKINDRVGNLIKSLPIFKLWDLLENKILADADGQKFLTNNKTIQSRYSKKYLGKGRGISLYTLVANFVAVNAKNIGLNEYEGHSLYDMIYNNKTDIEIDMVTGDNHSLNKLNFVALDSIDVDYVPSIKNIKSAANDLYSIKPPDNYIGFMIPKDIINKHRIKSQKRGIIRVLLSLIMQENTQSNIIRKLNSHARYSRLKAGLFEYNKIFKSIHVLNLIDNMQLRKVIRTARNRTEAYHQLQGIIRKLYYGIFKGQKIMDNRVSAHAARLIANCIIAYNSIILNTVYEKMLKNGVAQNVIDEFARISPIAWIHILFTGRYTFEKSNGDIDIAAMAKALEQQFKTMTTSG
jgi:TnpA family transposase